MKDFGLDIDDLEDFSHLYVSDSDNDDDEENRFEFDFSQITKAAKPEGKELNGNNSNNKYVVPDCAGTKSIYQKIVLFRMRRKI